MNRILSFFAFALLGSCANQTSPTGGPTDKTPPTLVTSSPRDNEKNFKGLTIQLLFSEDIKLKNPKEEILITPSIGKKSKFIAKGKRVTIEPELPWLENTTYSITLREGVQDITEGNPAENIRIAFSTGPSIDSLQLSGTINFAFHEKVADQITVAIYEKDTFDIFNHTPTYFTFTDKKGNYLLKNLKTGKFFVYAFEDKNKNLKVESKTEAFSFLSKPVDLSDTSKVNLSLIRVDARPIKITTVRHSKSISSIRFSKDLDSIIVKDRSNLRLYSFGSTKSEVLLHHRLQEGDSVQLPLTAIDSMHQRLDTTVYIKSTNQKMIDEQFKIQTIESKQDVLTRTYQGKFKLTKSIASITYDSIIVKLDTLKTYTITPTSVLYDTLNSLITIKIPLTDTITNQQKPSLYFGKAAFITPQSDSSKKTTTAIKYSQPNQTGTLTFEIKTTEPNYIIQLLKEASIEKEIIGSPKKFTYTYSEPGNFKIRVIVDRNNNGKWDPGNFYTKDEPEKLVYYKNPEGKTVIPTRANWEVGPLVITF